MTTETTSTPETPAPAPEEAQAAPEAAPSTVPVPPAPVGPSRGYMMLAYGLFLPAMMTGLAMMFAGHAGLLLDVTGAAGLFLLWRNKADFIGTIYESHVTWLTRTFIYTLAGFMLGFITFSFQAGQNFAGLVFLVVGIYYIYRVFKGFRTFARARALRDPLAFV
ncbi:hypothetical protein [Pararhodospirillum oryzae]|uniref:Uncharacterized protein n=1 Tax=Pararhodospirillum oryzae TaxID=478448 RepID=A0A512HBG0_9PROT|nr:hypothetical protein [Pararhodospirillum oryzae]GEO82789.1 hypothetical protein ROR02_29200 [Pararhodospirillum oryzae]